MSTNSTYSVYGDGSFDYINGTSELNKLDKIVPIDPNDVYTEDYEEDYLRKDKQSASALMHSYNQTIYQPPFYTYQEDCFNEEDEYKYLEKEREEANLGVTDVLDQSQNAIEKKQHMLRAQESISDSEFFLQHLEGGVKPHIGHLNKQGSIIEETELSDDQDDYEEKPEVAKATTSPATITTNVTMSTMSSAAAAAAVTSSITSRPLSFLAAMTTTTTAQAVSTKQPGDIVNDMIGAAVPPPSSLNSMLAGATATATGGDATAMMMAAAKLATTATGPATTNKVDDVIEDVTKKKQLGSIDETAATTTVRKSGVTPRQRWHWAYNKLIMQMNVSAHFSDIIFFFVHWCWKFDWRSHWPNRMAG